MSMNRISVSLQRTQYHAVDVVSILVFLGIMAFGLLIPYLGFYWDDYPLAWIADTYGSAGLEGYFSTNRPYWGLLYQFTMPVLGGTPWHWQVFCLFWRILAALSFWMFLRKLWPKKPVIALFASMAFLVYPGFTQQWISIIYSHFFIIMTAFLASLTFTLMAVRSTFEGGRSARSYLYSSLALGLSFLNLISLEYFFTLELIRHLAVWMVMGEVSQDRQERLRKTLLAGMPYLLLMLSVAVWRVFFFPYQTQNYELSLVERFAEEPLWALLVFVQNVFTSIWRAGILAWINIFRLPNFEESGRITVLLSFALVLFVFLVISSGLYLRGKRSRASLDQTGANDHKLSQPLWFGLSALIFAGWPIWLIDLSPDLSFSLDRFTIPFMMGSAVFLVGIIELLPVNFTWKAIVFLFIVSLSAGMHFRMANAYRRDWEVQRRFFWQLIWRMPGLKNGTTLLSNELPVTHYSDNSLTAPLNWIYAPGNESVEMAHLLVYPAQRLGTSLPGLEENLSIDVDYLAATFNGTTSQVVTVYYEPPACLRILDPNLDALNHMLPLLMQHSAELSDDTNITWEATATPIGILYPEEEHGWCYYYERAELARQHEDWAEVVELGDSAFALGDYPNDPAERLPFIEGYAHTGNWDRSVEQTETALQVSPRMVPVLCLLWERIERDTTNSSEKANAIQRVSSSLGCNE